MRVRDEKLIEEITAEIEKLETQNYFVANGYDHPTALIYTTDDPAKPLTPILATWGLIPYWRNSLAEGMDNWDDTLNARSETMLDKVSFKHSVQSQRCLIYVDGYFEYHHFGKKKYPFFVQRKDREMICLGGLWSEWNDFRTGQSIKTFTIITTPANEVMSIIHNNPDLKSPRMPLILHESEQDEFLYKGMYDGEKLEKLSSFMRPYPSDDFDHYPVRKLKGKNGVGNSKIAVEEFNGYPELWMTMEEIKNV